MLVLYFMLFLAAAAASLRWQAIRYERAHALAPQRLRGRPRHGR